MYGRKGKPLLEAAAVKRAVELAGREHPDVHRALVRLGQRGEHRLQGLLLLSGLQAGSWSPGRGGLWCKAPTTTSLCSVVPHVVTVCDFVFGCLQALAALGLCPLVGVTQQQQPQVTTDSCLPV